MDGVSATGATTGTTPATKNTTTAKKDAAATASFVKALEKAGAKLSAVKGHHYDKVSGGPHDGEYLNRTGKARNGDLFSIVERGGRTFHVYGSGADRTIVELPGKKTAATPATGGTAPTPVKGS